MGYNKELSYKVASEIWKYNPNTGDFIFNDREDAHKRWRSRCANKITGTKTKGRIVLTYKCKLYAAHRIAWLLTYGYWPPEQVDHIDGNPYNNKLENLRLATASENRRNKGLQRNNTSGCKGVGKLKNGKWYARIKVHGKMKNLGLYDTFSEARHAYFDAIYIYHGEFARVV